MGALRRFLLPSSSPLREYPQPGQQLATLVPHASMDHLSKPKALCMMGVTSSERPVLLKNCQVVDQRFDEFQSPGLRVWRRGMRQLNCQGEALAMGSQGWEQVNERQTGVDLDLLEMDCDTIIVFI